VQQINQKQIDISQTLFVRATPHRPPNMNPFIRSHDRNRPFTRLLRYAKCLFVTFRKGKRLSSAQPSDDSIQK
jgi:hypothetical protein